MAREIETYEQLREAVLLAQARPEGLAAVAYHGLCGGLKVICAMAAPAPVATGSPAPVAPSPTDPALVRLLANMVLLYQQEAIHVI